MFGRDSTRWGVPSHCFSVQIWRVSSAPIGDQASPHHQRTNVWGFAAVVCTTCSKSNRTAPNLTKIHNLTSGRAPPSGRISTPLSTPDFTTVKPPTAEHRQSVGGKRRQKQKERTASFQMALFLSQWHHSLHCIPTAEHSTSYSSHGNHCAGFHKRQQLTTNTPACVPLFATAFTATKRHWNTSRLRAAPPSANFELRVQILVEVPA